MPSQYTADYNDTAARAAAGQSALQQKLEAETQIYLDFAADPDKRSIARLDKQFSTDFVGELKEMLEFADKLPPDAASDSEKAFLKRDIAKVVGAGYFAGNLHEGLTRESTNSYGVTTVLGGAFAKAGGGISAVISINPGTMNSQMEIGAASPEAAKLYERLEEFGERVGTAIEKLSDPDYEIPARKVSLAM